MMLSDVGFLMLMAVAGLVAGAIASVSGFGIGSLLTPLLSLRVGTKLAVAAVSVPHLAATAFRFWLMRKHVDRRLLWSFGVMSAAGGLTGALLSIVVENPVLTKVFGGLLIFTGVMGLTGLSEKLRFHGWAAWVAGFVSGMLGGLVGNQGGIRSAAMLGFDVPRHAFVATATAVGLIVDGARMPVYLATQGEKVASLWPVLLGATVGAIVGTLIGERVLRGQPTADVEKLLREFLESMSAEKKQYDATKLKCGIVGRSGVGKSSLINAITDQKLAPVGSSKETTKEAQEFVHRGLTFVDLPGCGTKTFQTSEYVTRLKLQEYDLFIFVTESRFFHDDETIYSQLVNLKKPCFMIRNKFDVALENAAYDGHDVTPAELKEEIDRDIRLHLAPLELGAIYMVSARKPALYDFPQLLKDITNSFSGLRKMRLENDFAAWSVDALEKKRTNAMRVAAWYATLSAVNGLNPIVGLDIAIDITMLRKLASEVAAIYNITPEQQEYWKSVLRGPEGIGVTNKIVQLIGKYGTTAAIEAVLKSIAKRGTALSLAKYVPFVGTAVACGAGYALTYWFGQNLVDEYHKLSEEILAVLKLTSNKS